MVKYDVIFVDFPHRQHDGTSSRHPAVVLEGNKLAHLAAQVTSKVDKYNSFSDYKIKDWEEAGLFKPSVARLGQQEAFSDDIVINKIGHLSDDDIAGIEEILDKGESLNESSDPHFQAYDEKVKRAGYTDDEIAKVISIANEYENNADAGFISYAEMDEYADKIGLKDMSDSELRKTWDLYYNVLSRESFTDDDSTGIEKYKKYSDAASAFAEIINREARRRKEAGNYNPDVDESLNETFSYNPEDKEQELYFDKLYISDKNDDEFPIYGYSYYVPTEDIIDDLFDLSVSDEADEAYNYFESIEELPWQERDQKIDEYIKNNFNKLIEKYYDKLLDKYEDNALEAAQEDADSGKFDYDSSDDEYESSIDMQMYRNEALKEASYGGAYDIEDDMYFTKEELVEFGNDLAEQFSAWADDKCELSDIYMTSPVDLVMEVAESDGAEHQAKVKIDMRKIRLPRDIEKYTDIILKQWKDSYNEYHDYDESLNEEAIDNDSVATIIKNNLKDMFYTTPNLYIIGNNINFRMNKHDAASITAATIKRWLKSFNIDISKINIYRERGNHWGTPQDYYDYTISINESLNEGIDVESTGKNRMPLYMARDAIKKFNDDAKAYPYWVIKTDKWYDPEGLDITNKDYNIEYAGTYDECNNKLSQLINSVDHDWICLDKTGKDFVTLYYPHAIAKATFSIIRNPYDDLDFDESLNESVKRLNNNQKKIYIKEIEECEDREDLEDIIHEIFFYDKGLFTLLRHFPKDASFEELKQNKIDILTDSLLDEAYDINLPGYVVKYVSGYAGNGVNNYEYKYFRTEEEQKEFVDKLIKNNVPIGMINTYKVDNFYHTNESLNESSNDEPTEEDWNDYYQLVDGIANVMHSINSDLDDDGGNIYHDDYDGTRQLKFRFVCNVDKISDKIRKQIINALEKYLNSTKFNQFIYIELYPIKVPVGAAYEVIINAETEPIDIDLNEAKLGPYKYRYEAHWISPEGKDILLGANNDFEAVENIAINQIKTILESPWESNENKYKIIDSLYIYDSEKDDADVMGISLEDYIDGILSELDSRIRSNSLDEDTIKQNGKWVNKGKEGTHGTFKTKKAADAQRKAMFSSGYTESFDNNYSWAEKKLFDLVQTANSDYTLDDIQLYITPKGNINIRTKDDKDIMTVNRFSDDVIDELRLQGYFDSYDSLDLGESLSNESLTEDIYEDDDGDYDDEFEKGRDGCYYKYIRSKSVYDYDGFTTDYTLYMKAEPVEDRFDVSFVTVFGDSDIYRPDDGNYDYETDDLDNAIEWFDSYNGFEDDEFDESLNENKDNEIVKETSDYRIKRDKLNGKKDVYSLWIQAAQPREPRRWSPTTLYFDSVEEAEDYYNKKYVDESLKLKEDYQHKDDDWGNPYTYEDVEDELRNLTNNWTEKDGILRTPWEQEKDYGVLILKKHYDNVEVSDGRTGPGEDMSWTVSYSSLKK